jgi:hypothetical protein
MGGRLLDICDCMGGKMPVLKGGWQDIVGKTIEAVVTVSMTGTGIRSRIQFLFTDGSAFEMYSNDGSICGANRTYQGTLPQILSYEQHETCDVTVYGTLPAE